MNILANNNVTVLCEFVFFPEIHHAIKRHYRSHYDLDIFEIINMLNKIFGLMLAMIALWIKDHEHYGGFLFEHIFCEISIIRQQQFYRWKIGKTFIRWFTWTRLGKCCNCNYY